MTREAHRVKGEASTLGVTAVASLLGELESLPAALDRTMAKGLLARTPHEMERAVDLLRAPWTPPAYAEPPRWHARAYWTRPPPLTCGDAGARG